MMLFLTDKERLPHDEAAGTQCYAFEVPQDGLFKFQVWLVMERASGPVAVQVNNKPVFQGIPAEVASSHYACGSVALPRGYHRLTIQTVDTVSRILLAEDPEAVMNGKAALFWENRESADRFEARGVKLTDAQRELLRRHGFLFSRERDASYGMAPSGVPLGGIGAGKVELTPEGFFTALTINNNQDCPIYRLPGCYFAIHLDGGEGTAARLLQTKPINQMLTPVQQIHAELCFPEAHLVYHDPAFILMGRAVSLMAFSSHVPYDSERSGLPCMFFRFSITNYNAREPLRVKLLFSWENVINTGGHMLVTNKNEHRLLPLVYHSGNHAFAWSNRSTNYQQTIPMPNGAGLLFAAREDGGNPNSFGQHMIWTPEQAMAVPDRDLMADEEAFSEWFANGANGTFKPSGEGEFRAGALIASKTIAALATGEIDFMLAWHMPHYCGPSGKDHSVGYTRTARDVKEVVAYGAAHRDDLLKGTREVRSILESSSLPDWFVSQLLNCRFVSNTNTLLSAEGLFSVNEAPTGMCGCLGTLDQRTCAGAYWTDFYPELDKLELDLFARCQTEEGMSAHEVGSTEFQIEPRGMAWPDLAASYVIQIHRHYLRTGDHAFLTRHWPYVRRTLEWAISLDKTGDAVPTLQAGYGSTYDNEKWEGISAFIAGMHEAALTLGADLAGRMGEDAIGARWLELAEKVSASRLKYLWVSEGQGGYFRNAYDPIAGKADDSCFISSLAGDWAMAAGGRRPRLSRKILSSALHSIRQKNIYAHSMTDQSARPGTVFIQYPVAYFGAMALMNGDIRLAWDFARLQNLIISTPPSTHFNQTLTYTAEAGIPVGLPYYMTATVSWLFLGAIAGVAPDVAGGKLSLAPKFMPDTHRLNVPVFLPTGWFMLTCSLERSLFTLKLSPLRHLGDFSVKEIKVELPCSWHVQSVLLNDRPVHADINDNQLVVKADFDPGRSALSLTVTGSHFSSQGES